MTVIRVGIMLAATVAFGQSVAPPAFEVASVKPASAKAEGSRARTNSGRVTYANVPLTQILEDAYNIDFHFINGPASLQNRYDIVAKIPNGATPRQVPAMLQTLLMTRFKMQAHRETKVTEVYALMVGKGGPKLQRAEDAPDGENDRHFTITYGNTNRPGAPTGEGFQLLENLHPPMMGFKAVAVSMTKFAGLLKGYVQGLPVVNRTELPGRYNFTFQFDAGPEGRVPPDYLPPSLFSAVDRLGLKLEPRRVPVERLVVDHIEKTPTEN